ncbi:cobyric acid synthase [Chloroflexota bacterium]
MTARLLMVQGTASHAGKSLLVAALCRIFRQDGYNVAPFKAQNMSLNSFVTPDGGEIGRAQAVQAEAACVQPSVDMNPVLLKPEADSRSQVVLMGKPYITTSAANYYTLKSELWPHVTAALKRLREQYEVVVIEGAGGAAEINLAKDEIVNMRVARHANAPVLLIGDIERGGVFASLIGTLEILEAEERELIKAMVINKFRGDKSLLESGLLFLEKRSGVPCAGVIPWFNDIYIAEEDAVGLESPRFESSKTQLDIAVIQLPHMSNFDDFDPLRKEKDVSFRYVASAQQLGNPDLVILPGSKTTIADLQWLKQQHLLDSIVKLYHQGTFVIGICGGYQMLGQRILDPKLIESPSAEIDGLGLLPLITQFSDNKETHQVEGKVVTGVGLLAGAQSTCIEGYEIHMGLSQGQPAWKPFSISRRDRNEGYQPEGALDTDGRVMGTYMHGLFNNTELRQRILYNIALARAKDLPEGATALIKDREYDKLADLVRNNLDMDLIFNITGLRKVEHNE